MAVKAWNAIGIGLAVRDVTVLLDRYPDPDEKMRARELHESGGGPAPTALVTLARLGRKTALSATVGDDAVGRFILEGLVRENVDVSAVAVRGDFVSPTSVILVVARVVEVQVQAARSVREAGGLVVLDCGHPREGVDDLIAESDIAIFSYTYPAALHGADVDVEAFLSEIQARLTRPWSPVSGGTPGPRGRAGRGGGGGGL